MTNCNYRGLASSYKPIAYNIRTRLPARRGGPFIVWVRTFLTSGWRRFPSRLSGPDIPVYGLKTVLRVTERELQLWTDWYSEASSVRLHLS